MKFVDYFYILQLALFVCNTMCFLREDAPWWSLLIHLTLMVFHGAWAMLILERKAKEDKT
jgi:hypothetical protein